MNLGTSFDLLSRQAHCYIIAILNETDSLARHQLTRMVANLRTEDSVADEQLRRRVRINLHHNHLPKLAAAGVITYDEESVAATDTLETVAARVPLPDVDLSAVST